MNQTKHFCCKWQIRYALHVFKETHGVAGISRLLKIIGLFWKRALEKRQYSAKETCNFKEPTNQSHPIWESEKKPSSICWRHVRCDIYFSKETYGSIKKRPTSFFDAHEWHIGCDLLFLKETYGRLTRAPLEIFWSGKSWLASRITCQVRHAFLKRELWVSQKSPVGNKWVMSHAWMSHAPHIHASYPTCGGVMSHVWTSHYSHMN